jgi:hypothetical protein
MKNQEFSCSITVNISPKEAFKMISRVSDWWIKEVEGKTEKLNDEFTVHAGTTWKSFKITEVIPTKKIVWLVTDCNLPWNTDLKEWKGTQIIWEVSSKNNSTKINFTHIGLSKLDCGNQCMNSWGGYIQQSLFKLITQGKGLPNKF